MRSLMSRYVSKHRLHASTIAAKLFNIYTHYGYYKLSDNVISLREENAVLKAGKLNTSENFRRNGKFSAVRLRSTIFSFEKIVLRMRSAENFSVPWKIF